MSRPVTPTLAFWVLLVAGLLFLVRGMSSTTSVLEGFGFKITTDQVGLVLIAFAVIILLAAIAKGKVDEWILYRRPSP